MIRNTPEEMSFDLVVVGGGLAGLCAAIAAARRGCKTALVQDRPVFGGNGSSEIRVVPYGCAHSHGWTAETGIVLEMQLEDRVGNHEDFFDHGMLNSHWDMTMREAARREPNLTHFLNTSVRAVDYQGETARHITALHASQMGSEKEFIFRARQFVDATGDGTIGFLAGADFRYGREARHEHNERLAPVVGDDVTMGSTITMRARDMGRPVPFAPPAWIEEYQTLEEIGFNRKLYHLKKPVYGGYWWLEVCNPWHQIEDNAAIRDELHRHVLGVWNYIKNHSPDKAQAANYALEWIGQIPGKRESRRLLGDVVLTEHDVQQDQNWPDGVAYAGWWIDLHISGGILNKTEPGERENVDDNYKHFIRVAPFSVPLRAMYSRNVENLWLAGRCYSLTHVALGPVRVQLSLAMQGQAVGTAAAHALSHNISPRQTADPAGAHIQPVRQQLLRDDARLLGLKNTDANDQALRARAEATSEAAFDISSLQNKWLALDVARAQIVPLTGNRLEAVELFLKNEGEATQTVVMVQQIERIWDRTDGREIACVPLDVPARFEGWLRVELNAKVQPDTPHRIVVRRTPEVSWAQAGAWPTGTLAQFLYECDGGPEAKNAHLACFSSDEVEIPAYKHWRQIGRAAMALKLEPAPRPFRARMANNGCAWPEALPNLWMSDGAQPLPQSLRLRWDEAQEFNTVVLSFDTNLSVNGGGRAALSRPLECARHFRLYAETAQGEDLMYECENNDQRRHPARFETTSATALRLEIVATNGDGTEGARVYEIRVYNE